MEFPSSAEAQPLRILRETRFFAGLSEAHLEAIAAISRVDTFDEGARVYAVGDVAGTFYVLVSGSVRMTVGLGARDAAAGDVLRGGDVFGWAALTPTAGRRVATTTCLTPCVMLSIDGGRLIDLMERDHSLGYRIVVRLNTMITGTITAFVAG